MRDDNDDGGGSRGDKAEGESGGGAAEEADPRVAPAEVALDVAPEVGEAVAERVEAREREGIVVAVELEEEVEGAVALRLREGVVGEDGEEVGERRVEEARAADAAAEAEAEVGGGFAVVEVGGDEAREVALGFGFGEGFPDAV